MASKEWTPRAASGLGALLALLLAPGCGGEDPARPAARQRSQGEARLEGTLRQPDGQLVAGMELHLRPAGRPQVVASTLSDESGRYSFSVSPGRYSMCIGAADGPVAYAPELLRLAAGENRHDMRTPALAGIRVRVEEEQGGAPVAGAELVLKERFGRQWTGVTGPDGRVEFRNLPATEYRVLLMVRHRRVAEAKQVLFPGTSPVVLLRLPPLPPPKEKEGAGEDAGAGRKKARKKPG